MIHISESQLKMGLGAWFVSQLICLSIYVGGIADQLQFAPQNICLLYVENYHKDDALGAYIFDSYSPSCGVGITMGSIGLLTLFAVVGLRGFYAYKSEEPSRTVITALAVAAAVSAVISLIMASILTSGVSQTCHEFEKSGKSCGAVYGEGFFASSTKVIYYKNINTINAAVSSSWVVFILWAAYAAFEVFSYRNASLKWW